VKAWFDNLSESARKSPGLPALGCARLPDGSPEEDWFRAEQNIKSQPVRTEMQQQWKVETFGSTSQEINNK
jgi:Protein of unknown function (DUF2934)